MYLAISRFTVANQMDDQVRQAFVQRPHLVDQASGFLRMEVANPTDNANEFWLMTWWTDQAAFKAWHHSHTYRESHKGIPKGLRLDPKRTALMSFDVVAT
ncbi:MAG: antibiotic biosynthesis monooxygenase [Rhodoferax sp.]|nr:antibiotic biosynthesis monooxygenase [Rhodoferax sp.]